MGASGLTIYKTLHRILADVHKYWYCHLIKKPTWYSNDAANELNKLAGWNTTHMKERPFNGKYSVSIIYVLKDIKAAWEACNIHEGAYVWLFRWYLNGPGTSVFKFNIFLPRETTKMQEKCSQSYSAIVKYLPERYAMQANIATFNSNVRTFIQNHMVVTDYVRQLWTKLPRCWSHYTKKALEGLIVGIVNNSLCRPICLEWSEHQ